MSRLKQWAGSEDPAQADLFQVLLDYLSLYEGL
jgi:hypothetical protein